MKLLRYYFLLIFVNYSQNKECDIDGLRFWIISSTNEHGEILSTEVGIEDSFQEDWNIQLTKEAIYKSSTKDYKATVMLFPTLEKYKSLKQQIPRGYKKFPNGKYYKYYKQRDNWAEAKRKCASKGEGFLAIPQNNVDLAYLKSLITNVFDDVWVGIHDDEQEGVYKDIFGNENIWWKNKLNFQKHPPSLNCGYISRFGMSQKKCRADLYYICELDLK